MLKVTKQRVDRVTIFRCVGTIELGDGSVTLRNAVRQSLSEGEIFILLDLGGVSDIDASGLGEMTSAFTTTVNNGGQLKLLNLTKQLRDQLQITKLYAVFEVHDDENAASLSFR